MTKGIAERAKWTACDVQMIRLYKSYPTLKAQSKPDFLGLVQLLANSSLSGASPSLET